MIKLAILGAGGQVGGCFRQQLLGNDTGFKTNYYTSIDIDITKPTSLDKLKEFSPDVIINCAAYTAVDQAEDEIENAYLINAQSVESIGKLAQEIGALVLHYSTDYVYDDTVKLPHDEQKVKHPKSVYGKSKLEGEKLLEETGCRYVIIRTSWLYSNFGHNFYKTMVRLGKSKTEVRVVNDQIGSPTYAMDLSAISLKLIKKLHAQAEVAEIFNFSNAGATSWQDFAKAIMACHQLDCDVLPISSADFGSKATRPSYSVLDCRKIEDYLDYEIPTWEDALERCFGEGVKEST